MVKTLNIVGMEQWDLSHAYSVGMCNVNRCIERFHGESLEMTVFFTTELELS